MAHDPYGDFEVDEPISHEDWTRLRSRQHDSKRKAAKLDVLNEVGMVPPLTQEILERRQFYADNYVEMHQELFKMSTGIKPFGPLQIKSIQRTHNVLTFGGRSVIAEPRGFGKTSRTSNNALMAVLQGKIRYALVLASSVNKAEDILESIKTELIDNEELAKLYPAICACFAHVGESGMRARNQTYQGERTFLGYGKHIIRFPVIPGEVSSGSIIQVRTKDNVRGLAVKVRYGEDSGKVLRPDFVFMDDIQTDEEADSPTSVHKIVQTIKKSVLFGGSHSKPISAVLCCTPICPGDVASHFILNEPSWDVVVSKMVEKMPDRLDLWLNDYARILLDFDRTETGSRIRAALAARSFYEANREAMDAGAEWAWDWAYAWSMDPQTEISALQHAMNFLIYEGTDAFESECQCNVLPRIEETVGVKATIDEILEKTHKWPRRRVPVETKYICTHIDVNKNILTYVTVASAEDFRPMVIDIGEWPPQQGAVWKKRDIIETLRRMYPTVPEDHELIYIGLKDLINQLGKIEYKADDGRILYNNLILADMRYQIDEVQRAIRDSDYRNITICASGQGIGAKKTQFMDRHYEKGCQKHHHCATVPTRDRLGNVLYIDVNYFKTLFHKGIKTREGLGGSLSLFTPNRPGDLLLFAKHSVAESPIEDKDPESNRTVIVWENKREDDNEYFDNTVAAMAGLFKLGVSIRAKKSGSKGYNIQDFINQQKQG